MDDFRAKDLLADILDDHDIVRQLFLPTPHPGADWLGSWQKLRDELMYQNRFFPDVDIDLDFFEEILVGLVLESYEVPDTWFRARIQNQDALFLLDRHGSAAAAQRVSWASKSSRHSLLVSRLEGADGDFRNTPTHRGKASVFLISNCPMV